MDVSPVSLNKGEKEFVTDLRAFYDANPSFFEERELYLLRNMSRGRGIGFFEAGNFHPDFILWLLTGDRQFVTFVDPKGLRNTSPYQQVRWWTEDVSKDEFTKAHVLFQKENSASYIQQLLAKAVSSEQVTVEA